MKTNNNATSKILTLLLAAVTLTVAAHPARADGQVPFQGRAEGAIASVSPDPAGVVLTLLANGYATQLGQFSRREVVLFNRSPAPSRGMSSLPPPMAINSSASWRAGSFRPLRPRAPTPLPEAQDASRMHPAGLILSFRRPMEYTSVSNSRELFHPSAPTRSRDRLTMRCSEPGHRAPVAIHTSRGPGR
jgi:hypothetical protein